ncbi:MAG: UDP-N-acetylmuramate dehydrogenase [Verrucomicrobia bacterium]|nr:UDP-N-acetylmuramate dehydrogenase [Verrucomicrobiota bacterium]
MADFSELLPGIDIRENAPLSGYTTFKLGGPCRCLISCSAPDELIRTVGSLTTTGVKFVILGGGSNVLVSDAGYDGVVVRFVSDRLSIEREDHFFEVTACSPLDKLAEFTAREGISGLMSCTGIPGTVGGAIAGNAGAWGEQIADVLQSVTLMDETGAVREADASTLGFAYRRSDIQQSGETIISACFSSGNGDRAKQMEERARILKIRAEKHPDLSVDPCIGSIFRNIEPTSAAGRRQAAGWFLEEAGALDMRVGGARVFEKHANIVVKGEGCTAQDVRDLVEQMAHAVKDRFDLELKREVRYLGEFEGEEHRDDFF